MKGIVYSFDDLNTSDLHDLLKLRIDVFIVEQNCPYNELDGKDKKSFHYIGFDDNVIVATSRILPPGLSYQEASIGRVVVAMSNRNKKAGEQMMIEIISFMDKKWPNDSIRISAQEHLKRFYENLGFKWNGKSYLEDNIPHIEMLLKK